MDTFTNLTISEAVSKLTLLYGLAELRQFMAASPAEQLARLGLIANRHDRLESWFSALIRKNYEITSEFDVRYNCIAWAVDKQDSWWWPNGMYWPLGVSQKVEMNSFMEAYATEGFEECADPSPEVGYKKVAIYEKSGQPTHAAKLLPSGKWSSKVGRWEDLSHDYDALCGQQANEYGSIVKYMRKKIQSTTTTT